MKADPLARALAAQRRAARQGFDWPRGDPALWDKLAEELAELKAVRKQPERAGEELGDLLFMVVNLARHLGVDPGRALERALRKFQRRYAYVIAQPELLPAIGDTRRLAAMERRWQEAKRREHSAAKRKARPRHD